MSTETVLKLEAKSVRFLSVLDEAAFFEWLKSLPCVRQLEGKGASLFILVAPGVVDEEGLRELLALFFRYNVDMRQLAALEREEFSGWLRDEKAYWHTLVFGQTAQFGGRDQTP